MAASARRLTSKVFAVRDVLAGLTAAERAAVLREATGMEIIDLCALPIWRTTEGEIVVVLDRTFMPTALPRVFPLDEIILYRYADGRTEALPAVEFEDGRNEELVIDRTEPFDPYTGELAA